MLSLVALLMPTLPAEALTPPERREVPTALREQLDSLRREKAQRTAPQRKLDSRLLYTSRMRRGAAVADRIERLRTGVAVDVHGAVSVDLRGRVSDALLEHIESLGGNVIGAFPRFDSIRAQVPLDALETLAAHVDVRQIRPADRAITHKVNTSEGDAAHAADTARSLFSVDGAGITVGVLSDGADSTAARQASGDLPGALTILDGQGGSGSEGTAMMEIVYDLAPGASLLFATGFNGQAQMASNILALRAAGADIIVDDVAYFAESVFQDDNIASAVDSVVDDGALYFSSAGNSGNANDGTSGVWEGDFALGGSYGSDEVHDFGSGISVVITQDSPFLFSLQWSDEDGASGNDYDLLLVTDDLSTILAASTTLQNGDDSPFEWIDSTGFNDTGLRLLIVRDVGAANRVVHLNANRGRLSIATAGQTSGHSAARGAISVAAVDARTPGGAGGVFNGSESIQTYSSDGPRRVFYQADGTPITPGNFSTSGGELRDKPDLAAGDCVSTATPGFNPFCGTSAAAPHAAAIAALLLDLGAGALDPAMARAALMATALDIEATGLDADSGAGIVEAAAAAALIDGPDCGDGLDNDGDGDIDTADHGCVDSLDASERSVLLPCDDGTDNDSDGWSDFPADPGCASTLSSGEDPQCQDGVNNDGQTGTDFDGGESILGAGGVDPAGPDPQCVAPGPTGKREAAGGTGGGGCGMGGGALAALLAAMARGRRNGRSAPRS